MDPTHVSPKDERAAEDAAETSGPALTSVARVPSSYLAGNIKEPVIQRLAQLQLLLQNARFVQFWEAYKSPESAETRVYLDKVPTFVADVQRIALQTVALSFKRISVARLARYLDVEPAALPALVTKQAGWSVDGEYVVVPASADTEIKAVTVNEQIQLEQLHKLLVQAQPAPLATSS